MPGAILALGLVLAGCGDVPRPFAGTAAGRLLAMPDSYGVVVADIADLDPSLAEAARNAIAARLHRAEIPASTQSGNRASYWLRGFADPNASGTAGEQTIEWILEDPHGNPLHWFDAPLRLGSSQIGGIDAVATQVAEAIRTGKPGRGADAAVDSARVPVAVVSVANAPGDGNNALERALRTALVDYGLRVSAEAARSDGLLVSGEVNVSKLPGSRERVDLAWMVREPDGDQVGTVNQTSEIQAGLLDRRWGEIAAAVADGAASGIAALVERVESQRREARSALQR